MGAFVVMLHEDEPESSDKLRASIEEKFPGSEHFKFTQHTYLVTGPRLVTEVLDRLGFDDDDNLYAAVFRLNGSFSGRSWNKLWDWMRASEEVRERRCRRRPRRTGPDLTRRIHRTRGASDPDRDSNAEQSHQQAVQARNVEYRSASWGGPVRF